MEKREILKRLDHTLLKQDATWEQIKKICDEGVEYGVASVCIPPSFVKRAAEYLDGRLAVCTVIGFPNGYMTTASKVFETEDAVKNGADEIDMVINIGMVKEGNYGGVLDEIRAESEEKTYILVAHNGIARVIQSYFYEMTNEEYANFGVKNCAVMEYEFPSEKAGSEGKR